MDIEQQRQGLAGEVQRRRKARGWSKEKAAREAEISSITWKRIEDALPVQDVKLTAALQVLGMGTQLSGEVVPVYPDGSRDTTQTVIVERPVGLGLDADAADLTEDDIEDIRALIRAKRARRGLS